MTAPRESLTTENVVGSTAIDQELDLEVLSADLEGADYDREVFPGLVYRLQDPKATCLVFRSGKLVLTGARSIDDLEQAGAHIFDELRELGLEVPDNPDLTIQNIVTSGDLGSRLNLNAVAVGFGLEHVEYEPEQFPGLIYRLPEPDVVTLLFGSGQVVITGVSEPRDAETAMDIIQSELRDLEVL